MQLSLNFSALLASLVLVSSVAEAAPISRRNTGLVTLPLKSIQQPRSDVHPLVYFQQHANRANKRLARMTGRAEPSDHELATRLHKRLETNNPHGHHVKRYNPTSHAADALAALRKGKAPAPTNNLKEGANNFADASAGFNQVDLDAAFQNTVATANAPTAQDSLGLDIEANDTGYVATVQIGTPPTNFRVLMDSGSADFWVAADKCQSEAGGACSAKHQSLGATSSSSFADTGKPFKVTYGSGEVSGTIVTDDVTIAGLSLPKHTFGTANVESPQFSDDAINFDGLMGLAQSTLSEQKTPTPPESLASAGTIPAAIVSYKISRLSDGKNDGEISFGGLDPNKFDSSTLVTLNNVNQQGFWEANLDAVTLNGQDLGLQGRTAILDTGTTLMIVPAADAQAIHAAIPGAKSDGQGGFTIPCTSTASLALTFGGQSFNIQPQDLTFLPVDQNNLTGDCQSGISAGQIGGAQEWLVGDVFLKNAYFSHNVDKNTIQLAKLK